MPGVHCGRFVNIGRCVGDVPRECSEPFVSDHEPSRSLGFLPGQHRRDESAPLALSYWVGH
jgi:hypothetical protein